MHSPHGPTARGAATVHTVGRGDGTQEKLTKGPQSHLERMTGRIFVSETAAARRSEALPPGEFFGDLDCLPPFEILQMLHYLRKGGVLRIECTDPSHAQARAEMAIIRAGIAQASCGHLEGREAILATALWRHGRFSFMARSTTEIRVQRRGAPLSISEPAESIPDVLLHAAWLTDEVEARNGSSLPRDLRLQRSGPRLAGEMATVPGAAEIASTLEHHPGLTRKQMETTLPFAPLTLCFAVGRLAEEGLVVPFSEPSSIFKPPAAAAAAPAAVARTTLRRVLVAFAPGAEEGVLEMLSRLSLEMTGSEETGFFDPTGVSFMRLRISPALTASITVVPVLQRHRFLFESLLPSARIAAFLADEADNSELASWLSLVPSGCSVIRAKEATIAVARLRKALESDEA